MKFRRLDDNFDWTRGDKSIVSDERALYFDIITVLRTFKGECFADINMGLNVFNIISVKNLAYAENLIRDILEKHPEIVKIDSIKLTRDNDKPGLYYINISIISIYGQTLIEEELKYNTKDKETT